jgi:hypothetical protein
MNRRSFFRFLAGAPIAACTEVTVERYGFVDITDCAVVGYSERIVTRISYLVRKFS